ncbi:hypothetical protein [Paenibacillus sp. KN14-4R]|uniref:hypothetical protein n=1 Tax=Paenibacillus sp. KN14-4R TaxID=3445773 RepID=UPI003F9F1BE6
MIQPFFITPSSYHTFESEAEQLDKCKEWGLVSSKAAKTKTFYYKGKGLQVPCHIIGFVDNTTAVIELDNNQLHCIHPSYLKEMQAANYSQRQVVAAEDTQESDEEGQVSEDMPTAESIPAQPIVGEPAAKKNASNVKKEKAPKLQLPEEKVKMRAIVQEFTTVPNHFSDNDDEVIIYESVTILDPETEIGTAWSSHSNTLKKLELVVGDTITFECKIVAKKLTKHPVPYKINNPAKMQKV